MNRVKVNSIYKYNPCLWDQLTPPPNGIPQTGEKVKVINKYGCPPANTMGQCYIESLEGHFYGMVSVHSLDK